MEELEVYLSQEKDFEVFLKGGKYENWESAETNPDRIVQIKPDDRAQVGHGVDANAVRQRDNAKLQKLRKDLRTVLSIVGKCVSEGHYNSVVRHSTSLQWIYNNLRSDYDIQTRRRASTSSTSLTSNMTPPK